MKMFKNPCWNHFTAAFIIGTIALLSGCASYNLGSSAELPFESIYIRPAANDSFAPQAQALLSAQLREAFIRDGRVKVLANEADADAVLEVTLTDYRRRAAARSSADTVVAQTFDLSLIAVTSLYNQNQGSFYFQNRQIQDVTTAYTENPYLQEGTPETQGFQQSEYQAMPQLTRGLARKIADEVLSPWEPRSR